MSRLYHPNDSPPETVSSFITRRETVSFAHAANAQRINKRKGLRRINIENTKTLLGDRTNNTPAMRKDTKHPNRIMQNLPNHDYLLSLPKNSGLPVMVDGKGSVDIQETLALVSQYRFIKASQRRTNIK